MRLARIPHDPSTLLDFFQEGFESLGAVCERTWHDRLQLVAEGRAARFWNSDGALLETELHFVAPADTSPRQAESEVFPGCPLTFRLTEELRSRPLTLERGVLQSADGAKPPTLEVAEKLWHTQMPGTSRWRMDGAWRAAWHFSLLALGRCEVQAIDQHWTLQRVGISLPGGERDEALAAKLDFLQLSNEPSADLVWPAVDAPRWTGYLRDAFQIELQTDLAEIQQRQQRYLRRELARVDAYFTGYEKELRQRHHRSHSENTKLKTEERLTAAKAEHARRRQDQIQRHEIRVRTSLDALLVLAEQAWQGTVLCTQKSEAKTVMALFVPRLRRWMIAGAAR